MYIIIQSGDDKYKIEAIPKIWLCNKTIPNPGEICDWYYPRKNSIQQSKCYAKIEEDWYKKSGRALCISDSYLTANFMITAKNLKFYKFSIIEFIDVNSTVVVPVSWIQIDNKLKHFFCKWPENLNSAKLAYSQNMSWKTYLRVCCPKKFYNTYSEAKNDLKIFCETSTTEIEDFYSKPRIHNPKRHFDLLTEEETLHNKIGPKKYKVTQQIQSTGIQINNKDNYLICEQNKKLDITNVPKLKTDTQNDFDNTQNYSVNIQGKVDDSKNGPVNIQRDSNDMQKDYVNIQRDVDSTSQEMFDNSPIKILNKLNDIKKEVCIIKVDSIKNQELLTTFTENARCTDKQHINRGNLKIPVHTIDKLDEIEEYNDKINVISQILQRDAKSIDVKRITYVALKILMKNQAAEFLNMEGRRGKKKVFAKYKLFTSIADCVKDLFPEASLHDIKSHVSDWLKQAPKRM